MSCCCWSSKYMVAYSMWPHRYVCVWRVDLIGVIKPPFRSHSSGSPVIGVDHLNTLDAVMESVSSVASRCISYIDGTISQSVSWVAGGRPHMLVLFCFTYFFGKFRNKWNVKCSQLTVGTESSKFLWDLPMADHVPTVKYVWKLLAFAVQWFFPFLSLLRYANAEQRNCWHILRKEPPNGTYDLS